MHFVGLINDALFTGHLLSLHTHVQLPGKPPNLTHVVVPVIDKTFNIFGFNSLIRVFLLNKLLHLSLGPIDHLQCPNKPIWSSM